MFLKSSFRNLLSTIVCVICTMTAYQVTATNWNDGDTLVIQVRNSSHDFGRRYSSNKMSEQVSPLVRQKSKDVFKNCGKIRTFQNDKSTPQKSRNNNNIGSFLQSVMNLYSDNHFNMKREQAFAGEIPWMAALLVKSKGELFYCGGALIDHLHILTAASCLARMERKELSQLKIILGAHDTYNPFEDGRIERVVSIAMIHKGFDAINMENNIALIRLSKSVPYSSRIQPICLPTDKMNVIAYQHNEVIVSGWGQLLFDPLKYLNKLELNLWEEGECSKKCDHDFWDDDFPRITSSANFCGANNSNRSLLCMGNNGAPLVLKKDGKFHIVGITSWGIGTESDPCVFTRVDKYMSWIKRNVVNSL